MSTKKTRGEDSQKEELSTVFALSEISTDITPNESSSNLEESKTKIPATTPAFSTETSSAQNHSQVSSRDDINSFTSFSKNDSSTNRSPDSGKSLEATDQRTHEVIGGGNNVSSNINTSKNGRAHDSWDGTAVTDSSPGKSNNGNGNGKGNGAGKDTPSGNGNGKGNGAGKDTPSGNGNGKGNGAGKDTPSGNGNGKAMVLARIHRAATAMAKAMVLARIHRASGNGNGKGNGAGKDTPSGNGKGNENGNADGNIATLASFAWCWQGYTERQRQWQRQWCWQGYTERQRQRQRERQRGWQHRNVGIVRFQREQSWQVEQRQRQWQRQCQWCWEG
ncbi:hypothetical protein GN958_ATG13788 [Phytophthora infestans]|uniref:Uncharacterized protein n=1 Tax=Phytophthora infestans TaxID=4787 RepID=A0A8S9UBX2_PHYIN|nr:hypothetical protein GN958_ATG13788 [Phytophthora infestans]